MNISKRLQQRKGTPEERKYAISEAMNKIRAGEAENYTKGLSGLSSYFARLRTKKMYKPREQLIREYKAIGGDDVEQLKNLDNESFYKEMENIKGINVKSDKPILKEPLGIASKYKPGRNTTYLEKGRWRFNQSNKPALEQVREYVPESGTYLANLANEGIKDIAEKKIKKSSFLPLGQRGEPSLKQSKYRLNEPGQNRAKLGASSSSIENYVRENDIPKAPEKKNVQILREPNEREEETRYKFKNRPFFTESGQLNFEPKEKVSQDEARARSLYNEEGDFASAKDIKENRAGIGEVDEIEVLEKGKDIFGEDFKVAKIKKLNQEDPAPFSVVLKGERGNWKLDKERIRQLKEYYDILDKRKNMNPFAKNKKNPSKKAKTMYNYYKQHPMEATLLMYIHYYEAGQRPSQTPENAINILEQSPGNKEE